ncbi:hypothetical protein [Nesterenkonia muleiensis]|nr:hypothetical protein [Nesterenkonia muleiensis]
MSAVQLIAVVLVGLTVMLLVFLGSVMMTNRKNDIRRHRGHGQSPPGAE